MATELAIIGAGNMAEAIARGVLRNKIISADAIAAADPSAARRELFSRELKIRSTEVPQEAARDARMLLLSVKPQMMADVLKSLSPVMDADTLIISIAAGLSTQFIETHLGKKPWRVVRVMPNTPMLVGEGMSALASGQNASAADLDRVRQLFESAGKVIEVDEDKMNAVTAMSGSGPAYFFLLVEQMIRAGESMGLTAEQSSTLAKQTALGAAKLLTSSDESPAELRRKVTSPGGTTHAAITHMESSGLPDIVVAAIQAAERRGKELGG